MHLQRITFLLVVSMIGRIASAQLFDKPPADALAWWSVEQTLEPSDAEIAQRALLESVLKTTLRSGVLADDGAVDLVSGLLIASTVGSTSHQFIVLNAAGAENGRLTSFQGVLEIRGDVDHRALVDVAQSVLVDAHADAGEQRRVELPRDLEGVAFRRRDWPSWLVLTWASTADAFYVGVGEGALEQRLSAAPTGLAPWDSHVAAVRGGDAMLTACLNVDLLRQAASSWFGADDAAAHVLNAWALSNARLFMVHARLMPQGDSTPLLAIDATWESRTDPVGTIRRREVTGAAWPDDLAMSPPPGRFAIVAPMRTLAWIQRGASTYMALNKDDQALPQRLRRWGGRTQGRIRRLERASATHLIIGDGAAGTTRLPLLGVAYIEVDRNIDMESYERELGLVLRTLGDAVVFDETRRIWSVRVLPEALDPTGAVSILACGMAQGERPVLVIGWGVDEVEAARRRLAP